MDEIKIDCLECNFELTQNTKISSYVDIELSRLIVDSMCDPNLATRLLALITSDQQEPTQFVIKWKSNSLKIRAFLKSFNDGSIRLISIIDPAK